MKPGDAAKKIKADAKEQKIRFAGKIHRAALAGAEVIASSAPVDRGTLKGSVHVEREPDGGSRIVVDAPHAMSIELGSRPHTPPLEPLIAWVRRHRLALGVEGKGTVRDERGRFTASPEVVRIARAIQRKIATRGTKPTYFVFRSLPRLVAILAAELLREPVKRRPKAP